MAKPPAPVKNDSPDDDEPGPWELLELTVPLLTMIMEQEGADSSTITGILVLVIASWSYRNRPRK